MSITSVINKSTIDSLKETSLFNGHLLPVKSIDYKFHFTHYDYLPFGILFLSFAIFVWLYISYSKRLKSTIQGFFVNRFANQLARDEFSLSNRVTIFLSVLFVFTLTLFTSQTFQYLFGMEVAPNGFLFLNLIIGASVVVVYLSKFIAVRLSGYVFQMNKAASDYILTVFLYCNTLGLFLLPIVICISFVKQISPYIFIYIGLTIIGLFLITRIIKGLLIWLNGVRASRFYLFLYLCTLEILPIVILVKICTMLIKQSII